MRVRTSDIKPTLLDYLLGCYPNCEHLCILSYKISHSNRFRFLLNRPYSTFESTLNSSIYLYLFIMLFYSKNTKKEKEKSTKKKRKKKQLTIVSYRIVFTYQCCGLGFPQKNKDRKRNHKIAKHTCKLYNIRLFLLVQTIT